MERSTAPASHEEGSVMVLALLVLVFLTIIGISAGKTTSIELQIAGNERFRKIAFFNSDSGIHASPKLISLCVDSGEPLQNPTNITFLNSSGAPNADDSTLDDVFFYEIMGYDELLGRDAHDAACDLRFSLGGHNVDVDVDRSGQQSVAGGGVEFGSGAEGVGVGSTGGVALLFTMDSLGDGPRSSRSNVEGVYRKVLGISGGL